MKKTLYLFVFAFVSITHIPVTQASEDFTNRALRDLSVMFSSHPKDPTFGMQYLDRSKLDYSVRSLKYVNQYLDKVRKQKMTRLQLMKVILRTGAYVGEVLRRNDKASKWIWIDKKRYAQMQPKFAKMFANQIGIQAVLFSEKKGSMTFPLGKVQKYIINGPEDNLQFYVQVMMAKKLQTK